MVESENSTKLTVALLSEGPLPNSFALNTASLVDLQRHAGIVRACVGREVITPYAGEMAQLLDRSREGVEAEPLGAARAASDLLRAFEVMEGARTHVVDPDGGAWAYDGGGVRLATWVSSDVTGNLAPLLMSDRSTCKY